jgi:hypothetical protein
MTGPSSGNTNTKYAKEGNIKIKEASILHIVNRTGILEHLLE